MGFFRNTIRNTQTSPESVSPEMLRFWEALNGEVRKDLSEVFPRDPQYRPFLSLHGSNSLVGGGLGGGGGGGGMGMWGGLESDIGKLFTQKITVFGEVEGNRVSPLLEIMKICFKAFLESVREHRLDPWGMLQIQIDALFARQSVWSLLNEADSEGPSHLISSLHHRLFFPLMRCCFSFFFSFFFRFLLSLSHSWVSDVCSRGAADR